MLNPRNSYLFLASALSLGLAACNGTSESFSQVEPDWIHNNGPATPTPVSDPADAEPQPTASPQPSQSPSTTPSPSPTPTPTVTPMPSPTVSVTPSPVPTGSDLYTGPAEVEPYVQKFIADALIQGVNVLPDMTNPKLQIRIASLDAYGSSVIGLCETGGGLRRVTFDPDFWNSVSDTQKELVAHHELGHCVLYRPHRSTLLSSGAYASIMYPIIMSSSSYQNNYAYYQEELFTYGSSSLESFAQAGTDPDHVVTHICDLNEISPK